MARGGARERVRALLSGEGHGARLATVGHLLAGNFLAALLGFVALALCARALGPAAFGQLVLIYTFTRVVERVVSFQSWQPVIRFGAGLDGEGEREDLKRLLKFGLALDLGAAFCAFAVAVAAALLAAPLFGWSQETTRLLVLYSGVLLFQLTGMPTAVQRMAGRFRLIAYGQLANLALRTALCLLGLWQGWGIAAFAAIWAGTQVLGNLTTLALAFGTLRRMGVTGVLGAKLSGITQRFPGLWGFAFSSNFSLTLWASAQQFDTLIVGLLADPASAGLYHVAKRIASLGQQVGTQVQAVLYPDITRLWSKGRTGEFRRVVVQVEAFLFAFSLLALVSVALIVHPLLRLTAGPGFVAAAPLVVAQMGAVVFLLSGSAARVALLAMGRQREVLATVVVATLCFHATAFATIPAIGAMGGNVAHIVLGLVWTAGLALSLHRALKREAPATPAEPAVEPTLLAPKVT